MSKELKEADMLVLKNCRRHCDSVDDCFCSRKFPGSDNITYEEVAEAVRRAQARSHRAARQTVEHTTTNYFINKWFKETPWAKRTQATVDLLNRTIRCLMEPQIKKGQKKARFHRQQGILDL